MDPSMILQIIAIIILLMLSAYFSSAETALTTVNPHSMRAMAEDGNKKAAIVLKLIENPSQMLSSVLVGNNLVNISLTSLTTTIAIRIFGSMGAGIATAVITVLVLIFGEITPKTFATINNTKLALSYQHLSDHKITDTGCLHYQQTFYSNPYHLADRLETIQTYHD